MSGTAIMTSHLPSIAVISVKLQYPGYVQSEYFFRKLLNSPEIYLCESVYTSVCVRVHVFVCVCILAFTTIKREETLDSESRKLD